MVKKKIKIDNKTKQDLYEKFSNYALDLSKLVFGGVILAGIMNMDVNTTLLFGLGSLFVIILTILGYILTILKHNSRR
jgi:hypothetical protein